MYIDNRILITKKMLIKLNVEGIAKQRLSY